MNDASSTAPAASGTSTPGWAKPPSPLTWASPYSISATAGESSASPATSNRGAAAVLRDGDIPRQASTSAVRQIGTFT
jgi:hypothetical protein